MIEFVQNHQQIILLMHFKRKTVIKGLYYLGIDEYIIDDLKKISKDTTGLNNACKGFEGKFTRQEYQNVAKACKEFNDSHS